MSETDPATAIRDVATSVPEPWTADQVAAGAGVDRSTAASALANLLEAGELLAVGQGAGRRYYPDPVTSYVEHVGGALDSSGDELADRAAAIREALADWRDPGSLSSVQDLMAYHHAGRLVASSRLAAGVDVLDREWDVLVVLDTCRVDALEAVVDRLDDAGEVDSYLSVGSQTAEWIAGTFTADHADGLARTGYVSGNGWTKGVFEDDLRPDDDIWFQDLEPPTDWDVVDGDDLGALVHAWQRDRGEYTREVPWAPHPAPRTVTDHAIALARERADLDRLVVHYKQPHAPYTVAAERAGRDQLRQAEGAPFEFLQEGGDREVVWDYYLTDLRAAVEEVAALRRNVEGTVAVTADHGEAFGEYGDAGHRPAMLHPQVKRVPWVTVEGRDEGTRDGDLSAYEEADRDVEAQLEALGYR